MKKLTIKKKFLKKPLLKQTKHLNGTTTITVNNKQITLYFDKIGRLYDLNPRVDDFLNKYRGRQRNCIPVIIDHLNIINYGKEEISQL